MKNNKLTLKQLQKELELLKISNTTTKTQKGKSNVPNTNSIGHDIKDSFIQRLYMKSGAMSLFIITGLLGYINKVPILKKLIYLASFWYGKTTIWKIISKIRKAFVVFNAMIGVYIVFKSVGFSFDNILIGFTAMGHTYFEIFIRFVKTLFNWFFDLFDHKIVPNLPGEGSLPKVKTPFWNPSYSYDPFGKLLPDLTQFNKLPGFNIYIDPTPWYKDWSTILWIVGGVCGIYLGYKIISDPTYIYNWFFNPTIVETGATPPSQGGAGSSIGPGTIEGDSIQGYGDFFRSGIANIYNKTIANLNPLQWLTSSNEVQRQFEHFLSVQSDMHRADRNYYPFTDNNPFDSYLKKLRIRYLGETTGEILERSNMRRNAESGLNEILNRGRGDNLLSPIASPGIGNFPPLPPSETLWSGKSSVAGSPSISQIGLGPSISTHNPFADVVSAAISNKLESLPGTPRVIATGTEWITNKQINTTSLPLEGLEQRLANLSNPSTIEIPSENRISIDSTID